MGKARPRRFCRLVRRKRQLRVVPSQTLPDIDAPLSSEQKRLIMITTHKQNPTTPAQEIAKMLNCHVCTVYKWWNRNECDVKDQPRSGAPTVLTASVMRTIKTIKGKWGNSSRKLTARLQKKVKISRSSVRNGIKKCGLKAYHPRVVFRTTAKHRKNRKKFAKKFRTKDNEFWERVLSTDEKIFVFQQLKNHQNDIIYDTCLVNVPITPKDKYSSCMSLNHF
jgi:transposase